MASLRQVTVILTCLNLVRPAGVLIGLTLGVSSGIGGQLVLAIVQSLATGIFVHVTVYSILPSEFDVINAYGNMPSQGTDTIKLFCIII